MRQPPTRSSPPQTYSVPSSTAAAASQRASSIGDTALHVLAGVALLAAGACAALAFLGATALLVLLSAAEYLLVPAAAVLFVLAVKWVGYLLVPSWHDLAAATGNKLVCGLQGPLARITGFLRDGRCMPPCLSQPVLAARCVVLHFAAIMCTRSPSASSFR